MKWKKVAALAAVCLLSSGSASAHRIDEYLQATILSVDADSVHASMRLIPGVSAAPAIIDVLDTDHDGVFSQQEKLAYADRVLSDLSITIDGHPAKAQLDQWTVPDAPQLRDGLGEIHIVYRIPLPVDSPSHTLVLANHHLNPNSVYLVNVEVPRDRTLRIVSQHRNERQSTYELSFEQIGDATPHTRLGLHAWFSATQISGLFHLGMRHIAEGTDHLLFLLALLLPAPLLAVGSRWGAAASVRQSLLHVVGIVTAFTIGHSLTLTLAAMKVVDVSGIPVEILIAISILVSAIHALRPLFPGREAWIAAFFGLIHGLAFASTLDRLRLSHWDRLTGILAFNLGIEAMQMLVVALVLPSLLLLSRTPTYCAFRISAATFACVASTMWIAERLLNTQTPIDRIMTEITQRGSWYAATFFTASLTCWIISRRPARRCA